MMKFIDEEETPIFGEDTESTETKEDAGESAKEDAGEPAVV